MNSCKKQNNTPVIDKQTEVQKVDKVKAYEALGLTFESSTRGDLTYAGILCPGDDITAEATPYSYSYPDGWTYYKLYGEAGQMIDINLVRITCEMDPAYHLFFGTSNTTTGLPYSNPDLTWVTFRDDDVAIPPGCAGACFAYWDPSTDVTLPYTGWYTLAVFDYISCAGAPLYYNLTVTGLAGCTIVIDGCDTYVHNQVVGTDYMQDLIDMCAATATKHGKFVSCVAHLTNDWVSEGLITDLEKDAIMECAGSSGIPYIDGPSASGQGTFLYGEDIRHFSFHANTMPQGDVQGNGVLTYNAGVENIKFDIDCLFFVDDVTAIMTGVITYHKTTPALVGMYFWFKVVDNGEGSGDDPDLMTLFYEGGSLDGDCSYDLGAEFYEIEGGNIQVKP